MDIGEFLFKLIAYDLRFVASQYGLSVRVGDSHQKIFSVEVGLVHHTPCCLNDASGHTKPGCNGKGVGATGQADAQVIGRGQCDQIKLHVSVGGAFGQMGVDFELRVMGGDEGGRAFFSQRTQDGASQGRALCRVSASTQLVQQNKGAFVDGFQEAQNIRHMGRKGAQALFNRLLITDVGIDLLKA